MEDGRRTPIWRLLHGAPMLGGILAHYVLVVLLGVARLHELIGPEVNNA